MSDTFPEAVVIYLSTPPSTATATTFAAAATSDIEDMCAALASERARAHLEAVAEVASDKRLKKAARAAAYKLKSAGVAGEYRASKGIDLSPTVALDHIAAAYAPSIGGTFQMLIGGLPGAAGGWIDTAQDEPDIVIDPDMTAGRVHKRTRESIDMRGLRRLVPLDAGLAARLVRRMGEALAHLGEHLPAAFGGLVAWADRAAALGADEARSDARRAVTPSTSEEVPAVLFEHRALGPISVPSALERELDARVGQELHSQEAIDEQTFCARIDAATLDAIDAWWAKDGVREATAIYLSMAADVWVADGDPEAAAAVLGVSDRLASHTRPAREAPALVAWIRRLVNARSAWRHRLAHIEGHAHH